PGHQPLAQAGAQAGPLVHCCPWPGGGVPRGPPRVGRARRRGPAPPPPPPRAPAPPPATPPPPPPVLAAASASAIRPEASLMARLTEVWTSGLPANRSRLRTSTS